MTIARGRRLPEASKTALYRRLADGERALAAGMLLAGIDAAEAGDGEAAKWLRECAESYLQMFSDEADALADELSRMVGSAIPYNRRNSEVDDTEVKHEQNDEPGPAGVPVMLSAEYQQVQLFHMD